MRSKKILVVDDSLTSLMWQRMILRGEQYGVLTANDGAEGVATAMSEMPDLILMDVAMPNMNGFDACRALRANGATSGVPVIMVTTKACVADVERSHESGFSDYITKPIDKVELLAKVKSYLPD